MRTLQNLFNLIAMIFTLMPQSQMARITWVAIWFSFAVWVISLPIRSLLALFS